MSDDLILVQNLIHEIRGKKVMLDFDLARMYHVETRSLNQAVKRNLKRFPPDFMFQLTAKEWAENSSQFVTTSNRPKSAPPFAFTEQGVEKVAREMLKMGLDFQTIIQATGLSEEQVRALQEIPGQARDDETTSFADYIPSFTAPFRHSPA